MRVLLDTHALVWLAAFPERLGTASATLAAADTALVVSAASAWEIAIKQTLGRLALPAPVGTWLPEQTTRLGLEHLPIDWRDTVAVAELPPLHRDPFDRLLVAQARRHGLTLATADPQVTQYDVPLLPLG